MKANYFFYISDESFSYGDFPSSTVYEKTKHGFSININSDNIIDFNSLCLIGDFENTQINTLEELLEFVKSHFSEIEEINSDSQYSNIELFEELIEIIKENLKINRKVA